MIFVGDFVMKPFLRSTGSRNVLKQLDRYLKRELGWSLRSPALLPMVMSLPLLFSFWQSNGFRIHFFLEHSWFLPALLLIYVFDAYTNWLVVRCLSGLLRRKSGFKILLVFMLNLVKSVAIWIYFLFYALYRVYGRT